jgi:molybdate transport repressor ModE-like protein
MRVVPTLTWALENESSFEALDDRLMRLLDAIGTSDSLAAAAADRGISYRAAWGLLREYQRKFGAALVSLQRGRGASLTPMGERILAAQSAANRRLARTLTTLSLEIGPPSRQRDVASMLRLRVAASHDLALAALSGVLPVAVGLTLELSFMGSLSAIKEFAEGRADIAGFHVPTAGCSLELTPFFKPLRRRRDRLICFAKREQGLMLAHGNPTRVKNLRAIATKGLRFINRQRGSGTRLLIDQMLEDQAIDTAEINGYQTEEFTHAAVAATVASGGADAGVGLRAAAAEHQLAFVPLVREQYFFAVRARELKSPAIIRFIEALRSSAYRRIVKRLAGYQSVDAGSVLGLDALDAGAIQGSR